jgi:hypothetical protein
VPNFLVLEIYLLLSGNGKGKGWNYFLHSGSIEDKSDNYDVSNFTDLTIWRPFFPNGDIKVEMMSSPWNNFFRSLLHFVVVKSSHGEDLGRIIFRSVAERRKRKTQERRSFSIPPAGMLAVVHWTSVLGPFAECLPVQSSIRSVIQVWF